MAFYCSWSNSKSPQVPRTLLSILANLNNAVVRMVYIYPFISNSSSPFTNTSGIVLSAPIIIGITVTFMFHSLFLVRSQKVLIVILFFRFLLILLCGQQSPLFGCFFFLVVRPRLHDLFASQSTREVCASHSPGRILGCTYSTCSHRQISVSCTIPSRLPFSPSRV